MDYKLELLCIPVSDVDAAKEFYVDKVGFVADHDQRVDEALRLVQLTPPGSGCSIVIGQGLVPDMPPGCVKGLQLVVPDLERARDELLARGVAGSEIRTLGTSPTPMPHPLDNVGFVFFDDPDGNSWAVQQISSRANA